MACHQICLFISSSDQSCSAASGFHGLLRMFYQSKKESRWLRDNQNFPSQRFNLIESVYRTAWPTASFFILHWFGDPIRTLCSKQSRRSFLPDRWPSRISTREEKDSWSRKQKSPPNSSFQGLGLLHLFSNFGLSFCEAAIRLLVASNYKPPPDDRGFTKSGSIPLFEPPNRVSELCLGLV